MIARAVNGLLPLATAILARGTIGTLKARCRKPSQRSRTRRSPTSMVMTPVNAFVATASSSRPGSRSIPAPCQTV
jgi:hypothetical protein